MAYEQYWIPGIFMILGIIISAFISPQINWGVEKRRYRRKAIRDLIELIRKNLYSKNGYDSKKSFTNSTRFLRIKKYCSKEYLDQMKSKKEINWRHITKKELIRIEQKMGLI